MSTRTLKLDLRLSPEAKETLTAAAQAVNRSVSQFVLESALSRAEETLVERRYFTLDADHWAAFMAALDASPRDLPRLQRCLPKRGRLMTRPHRHERADH